jgi:hypothetical protein
VPRQLLVAGCKSLVIGREFDRAVLKLMTDDQ